MKRNVNEAQQALDFVGALKQIAERANQPDFAAVAWDALAQYVATDNFLYVGRHKEALRWPDFLARLDCWSRATDFASAVERVEQDGNLVFVQLDERSTTDDGARRLATMTIFEFDTAGHLCQIDSFQ